MEYVTLLAEAFHLKRLLLSERNVVVQLWTIDGRVGYLDDRDLGEARWVWLTEDRLAAIRTYEDESDSAEFSRADFVLRQWGPGELVPAPSLVK